MEEEKLRREIEESVERWDDALSRKDAESLLADYDEEITLFDVSTQLVGRDNYRQLWEACLPYFGASVGTERKDVQIRVCDEMAVMNGFTRLTGVESDSEMSRSWLRTTVCFRRVGGKWMVFHEHVSFPVDCETEQALYLKD